LSLSRLSLSVQTHQFWIEEEPGLTKVVTSNQSQRAQSIWTSDFSKTCRHAVDLRGLQLFDLKQKSIGWTAIEMKSIKELASEK
jgi:hypothetical protein